jgi:hypothetical protein
VGEHVDGGTRRQPPIDFETVAPPSERLMQTGNITGMPPGRHAHAGGSPPFGRMRRFVSARHPLVRERHDHAPHPASTGPRPRLPVHQADAAGARARRGGVRGGMSDDAGRRAGGGPRGGEPRPGRGGRAPRHARRGEPERPHRPRPRLLHRDVRGASLRALPGAGGGRAHRRPALSCARRWPTGLGERPGTLVVDTAGPLPLSGARERPGACATASASARTGMSWARPGRRSPDEGASGRRWTPTAAMVARRPRARCALPPGGMAPAASRTRSARARSTCSTRAGATRSTASTAPASPGRSARRCRRAASACSTRTSSTCYNRVPRGSIVVVKPHEGSAYAV